MFCFVCVHQWAIGREDLREQRNAKCVIISELEAGYYVVQVTSTVQCHNSVLDVLNLRCGLVEQGVDRTKIPTLNNYAYLLIIQGKQALSIVGSSLLAHVHPNVTLISPERTLYSTRSTYYIFCSSASPSKRMTYETQRKEQSWCNALLNNFNSAYNFPDFPFDTIKSNFVQNLVVKSQ